MELALVFMPFGEVVDFLVGVLARLFLVTSFELFLKLTKFFGRPTFLGDFCIFTGALAAFIFLARPSFFPASCTLLGEGLLELSIFLRGAADLT